MDGFSPETINEVEVSLVCLVDCLVAGHLTKHRFSCFRPVWNEQVVMECSTHLCAEGAAQLEEAQRTAAS